MKRAAVLAQTADPSRGSEFATGWGIVRGIYCDPRVLEKYDVDVFISLYDNNRALILSELEGIYPRPNIIFVPQVLPSFHRFFGRALRIAWEVRLWRRLVRDEYDFVHQVSPNAIAYLNPIFLGMRRCVRVVGPMRIEAKASVRRLYRRDWRVLRRHLAIRLKEYTEQVLFAFHRWAVKYRTALHLEPIAGNGLRSNQVYCPETIFIQMPAMSSTDNAVKNENWKVIWSGVGDIHRKNEDLARRVIEVALADMHSQSSS